MLFPFNLNLFTSHRKPNNSSLRYIGQPPRLLRLLRHVTAILIPESIMDVLSTWTRRPAAAMERHTCETLFSFFQVHNVLWTLCRKFQCVWSTSPTSSRRTHVTSRPSAEVVRLWHWFETVSSSVGHFFSALQSYTVVVLWRILFTFSSLI